MSKPPKPLDADQELRRDNQLVAAEYVIAQLKTRLPNPAARNEINQLLNPPNETSPLDKKKPLIAVMKVLRGSLPKECFDRATRSARPHGQSWIKTTMRELNEATKSVDFLEEDGQMSRKSQSRLSEFAHSLAQYWQERMQGGEAVESLKQGGGKKRRGNPDR